MSGPSAPPAPDQPLVSFLCVTHQRVHLLKRAIHCFEQQTWRHREMVLLHDDSDTQTRDFLAALAHPQIRSLVVPALPRLTQGMKRRLTVEAARGHYVTTWDDDDWSAPTRIEDQVGVLRQSGFAACTLERWITYDQQLGQAWLTYPRTWEASLLCERAAMPVYDDVQRAEDTFCIEKLLARRQLVPAQLPHQYIYLYHGNNIGSRAHFKRYIFRGSLLLPAAFAARVKALLDSPATEAPIALAELQAAVGPQLALRP